MLIAVLFGIVSGLYPAWKMSRLHPVNALRGGAQ
jgi:putative ABC transport system permease protein